MKNHFKKYRNEYISVSILMLATFVLLTVLLKLWNLDLTIPMKYEGLDDTSLLVNARMLTEQNWFLSTDKLGAPFGAQYYDFTASVLHNFDVFTLKIFATIVGNAAVAFNLEYLSVFFMIAIISYFVMRELKITNWVSVCASLTFTFMPYLFIRGTEHIVLTTCYFIPLSILLCVWVFEREDILGFNKKFFKNKRNWLVILFAFLIANNGIAYYPFFTCFLLLVTGISKLIKTKRVKYLLKSIFVLFSICFFMAISMIPVLIYNLQNGSNSMAIVRNGFVESEIYGLKIVQLFLPVNGHDISLLTELIDGYNRVSPFVNENISSYLGIMGICGFLFLMFVIFSKKNSEMGNRLALLSEMNIFLVLLGTVGGIGTMFALTVSSLLRAYNRISIFIAYVCILGFALGLDYIYKKYKKKWMIVAGIVFSAFCIFEQYPNSYIPTYDQNKVNYLSDEALIAQLESEVNENAMIYQLPYHQYPEAGTVYTMTDYQLFTGYIHSKDLKWSYGAMKGRESDEWNAKIASLDIPDMISSLRDSGFEGIYIDRRAYEPEELGQLESQLSSELNMQAVISNNGNLSYFILN